MPDSPLTDATAPTLAGIPEAMQPLLSLVYQNPTGEVAGVLLPFVAALVHPDYVCSLSQLAQLPYHARTAALECFHHCVCPGLNDVERGLVLRFIDPYLRSPLPFLAPR